MKILILRKPQTLAGYPGGVHGGACYQSDMLLHGLRGKLGNDVVEYERAWWMYYNDFGPGKWDPDIYTPKGFTIYRTLGDDSEVDRTDIEEKIKTRYFDYVVFAYTHYGLRLGSWELVTQYYPKNRIIFVDGGDLWSDLIPAAVDNSIYFKREIDRPASKLHKINFAIPIEKISTIFRQKKHVLAPMDPRNKQSYIYNDEYSYYAQYAESLLGITMKKSGWDCMRHYEILANNCIPLFLDIKSCPPNIMTSLPKDLLIEVLDLAMANNLDYFSHGEGLERWYEYNEKIQAHFRKYCTTDALAGYFLDTIRSAS